jgi:hypothetical protein
MKGSKDSKSAKGGKPFPFPPKGGKGGKAVKGGK